MSFLFSYGRPQVFPVSISADQTTIQAGEPIDLIWTSTYATSCVIEPDIGTVDANGSISITPAGTTTYMITATGPGGKSKDGVTVTVTSELTLNITSPSPGENITRPDVMVQGTIHNTADNETGVTVNGVIALVHGNQFVANHVPLEEGENTITVTATSEDGVVETTSIEVYAEMTGDYIIITADPESGVSPLETKLKIEGPFDILASELTYTYIGGGIALGLSATNDEYQLRLLGEAIFIFTVAEEHDSVTYTDSVAVLVQDESTLDGFLKEKWNGMKTAFINSNIEGALQYFHAGTREKYSDLFNAIGTVRLAEIATDMAEYVIEREELIEGTTYDISYFTYFIKDANGFWKIENF